MQTSIILISPRSLYGTDGKETNQREITRQFASLRKCAQRLACKSFFQDEGWKRILGVRRFLEAFDLDHQIDKIKLIVQETLTSTSMMNHILPETHKITEKVNFVKELWQNGPILFLAQLIDIHTRKAHAVAIYGLTEDGYKVKDSHKSKYTIPFKRCSYMQV